MNKYDLKNEIVNLIALKQEGSYWDFKREWYHIMPDMLHDIICMANNLVNKDAYLIIGVDEESDYSLVDMSEDNNRKNTQMIVDFLREKKFAGGIRPTVYVQELTIQGKKIDVIVVKNDYNTPYYLLQSFQSVYANNIYIRLMDTNTPKNSSADRTNVEYLWKKHFRLDTTPLERVMYYLTDSKNWVNSRSESSTVEYYKYFPEYTIEHTLDDERNGYEYYLFNQTDSTPHWYDITIRYHQTIIASLDGVALDGGRYFTTTPFFEGIRFNQNSLHCDLTYKYMIKETLNYIVHCYYYDDDRDEETHSHNCFIDCILLFDSEIEKEKFDRYIVKHKDEIAILVQNARLPYFPKLNGYKMSAFKEQYANVAALQKLLVKFRTNNEE